MKMALAQADLLARDLTILERSVPPHMLFLMVQQCQKMGLELRADVLHHLDVAAAAPLSQLDTLSVARIAKRVDDIATGLLNDLSPDDPRDGLYACAQFILTLVDEGRLLDVNNQAVLVALLLMDDLKDERKDADGNEALWRLDEKRWIEKAKSMLRRANMQGLYTTTLKL